MVRQYGGVVARNMINPRIRKAHPRSMDDVLNPRWVFEDYNIAPSGILDNEYRELIRGWGFDV